MLEQFFNAFATVDIAGIVITIAAGIAWGLSFRKFDFDRSTLLLMLSWYAPLLIGRIVYAFTVGVSGSGLIGFFWLLLYFLVSYLTRKIARHYTT